ncbi:MAG: PhzF family phenazine biosynthesis protein, partial [Bacteroidetes bacterium]|nr:PhzF family phenazine biosynthesis protein [Bacteroidota bacterium]
MNLPIYQVDAFTDHVFGGNPAAVCPLESWLPDQTMQSIATENNLSETAFIVPLNGGYHIRWFTPVYEVDLCGHATLASAFVIFNHLDYQGEEIVFHSRSGELRVQKSGDQMVMNFPADIISEVSIPETLAASFNITPRSAYKGKTDYLLIYESESDIQNLTPDFSLMRKTEARGVIVSAPGDEVDFVSRFFAPLAGVDEDPVTGSAHTTLTPFWVNQLGKNPLSARQISARGGVLACRLEGERVFLTG